jgi:hypothetical protein
MLLLLPLLLPLRRGRRPPASRLPNTPPLRRRKALVRARGEGNGPGHPSRVTWGCPPRGFLKKTSLPGAAWEPFCRVPWATSRAAFLRGEAVGRGVPTVPEKREGSEDRESIFSRASRRDRGAAAAAAAKTTSPESCHGRIRVPRLGLLRKARDESLGQLQRPRPHAASLRTPCLGGGA